MPSHPRHETASCWRPLTLIPKIAGAPAARRPPACRFDFPHTPVAQPADPVFRTVVAEDPALSDLLERTNQALYDSKAERRMLRES